MPYDSTAHMFVRMLEAAPVVPASVHRSAWRYATQKRNTDLKKRLIARADAPEDLVSQYAAVTSTELRGVYLSRIDTSGDQVVAAVIGERRASVLADALERSKKHPAVVAAAAQAFIARPTKVLAEHMAKLPSRRMTPAVAEAVLLTYDRFPAEHDFVAELRTAAANLGPDRARNLLPQLNHPSVVAALIRHDVGTEVILEAVARIGPGTVKRMVDEKLFRTAFRQFDELIRSARYWGRDQVPEISAAFTRLLARYQGQTIAQLRKQATGTWPKNPGIAPWADGAGDETRVVVTDADLEHAGRSVDVDSADERQLQALAVSEDPDLLTMIAARARRGDLTSAGALQVFTTLLWNPALRLSDRHAIADLADADPGTWRELAQVDAIALFPQDEKVRDIWCTAFPHSVLEDHGWEPFGGAAHAADLVPQWVADERAQTKAAVKLALQMSPDAQTLEKLPFRLIEGTWSGRSERSVEVTIARIMGMLADGLGENPAAWALFTSIKGEFPGTFGELIATCQAAAA